MAPAKIIIPIDVENDRQAELTIYSESATYPLERISDAEAEENGESPYQIQEGCSYEY